MTLECFASTRNLNTNPGPGEYQTDQSKLLGNKYSIKYTIRPRTPSDFKPASGTDFMPMTSSLSHIKKTIGKRFYYKEAEFSRGPNYLPDPNQFFTKKFKIKGRYEPRGIIETPGPADYTIQPLSKTRVPPQGSRSPIKFNEDSISPGPAAYTIPSEFGRGSARTAIRPRTGIDRLQEKRPDYQYNNLSVTGVDSRMSSFPKAVSKSNYDNGVPGPGHYNNDVLDTHRYGPSIRPITSMGRPTTDDVPYENIRRFPVPKNNTIGRRTVKSALDPVDTNVPGCAYYPKSTLATNHISIRNKIPERGKTQTPGPGDYDPKDPTGPEQCGIQFKGPEVRDKWISIGEIVSPGPAAYYRCEPTPGPKWTIGERSLTRNTGSKVHSSIGRKAHSALRSSRREPTNPDE